MSRQDLFEHILASLQETALDDAHWPETSALIDEACGSKGNFLVSGDGNSQDDIEIFFARFCFGGQRHPELERLYFEVYHALDERLPRIRQLPDSQLVHVSSLYTEEEKKTSLVYNEGLPLSDTRDCLNVRLDGPDGSRIVWVIADPAEARGWSWAQIDTVQRLLPHLRQFVGVRQALVNARALGSSFGALLENTRCGVIQLDPRGRIVAANDRACDLLRAGIGLTDEDGLLRASAPNDDADLQRLLARALPPFGGRGACGSMMLRRPRGRQPLVLYANPVGNRDMDLRPSRVAALVLVVVPGGRVRIDAGMVSSVLGLTPAESEVAVWLAQGYAIRDIAIKTGRSPSTIRWHIKHIFAKHGISRQVELVQLVLSLSDLPKTWR